MYFKEECEASQAIASCSGIARVCPGPRGGYLVIVAGDHVRVRITQKANELKRLQDDQAIAEASRTGNGIAVPALACTILVHRAVCAWGMGELISCRRTSCWQWPPQAIDDRAGRRAWIA